MSIKIDKEFESLIPPLSSEEFKQLEENCVAEGIRDPLVVWSVPSGDDILIDGHNRWKIAAKHGGIRFEVVKKKFQSRAEVITWIIKNQLGRRNIPMYVRAELALKLKPVIAEKAKENQGTRNDICQKSDKSIDTKKEIAKAAGVSHDTIHKVEKIQKKASVETKTALRNGEISINQAYSGIVAAENETRRQREAKELREAKQRMDEYQKEDNKVKDFKTEKQRKIDSELIVENLNHVISDAYTSTLKVMTTINNESNLKALEATNRHDLIRMSDKLSECYRIILKAQRKIVEVIDEKQFQ